MDKVNILNAKNIITFIIVIALIALSLYSLDILMILFASFMITCAIDPLINKMEKKIPRALAVTLVLFALLLAGILILVPVLRVSVIQITEFINSLPDLFDKFDNVLNIKIFNTSLASLVTFDSIKEPLAQSAKSLIENSITATKSVASGFTTIFAMAIVIFYLASDKVRLTNKFVEFFPQEQKEKAKKILDNISDKVGNYIFAQGLAMVFVGVVIALGLALIGEKSALLVGFLSCILDIIPVVGPAIAIIIALILGASGGLIHVILILLVFLVAQWAQNQLLKPVLFGKMLNMHPLMIIVALLLCARFLGFWGLILSPAIASVICVLVDELYLNRINNK